MSEIKPQDGVHRIRNRLHEIIFEADTQAGKWFDLILILSILSSVLVVMLDSVAAVKVSYGSFLYGIEWGFTSIPRSIYWAIVTMTTVGYGDISPKTNLGQGLASVIMILGYAIIAVPTGIVTAELSHTTRKKISTQACMAHGHDPDAVFCKFCSERLNPSSGK